MRRCLPLSDACVCVYVVCVCVCVRVCCVYVVCVCDITYLGDGDETKSLLGMPTSSLSNI